MHATACMNLQRITLSEKKANLKDYMLYDDSVAFLKWQHYRNGEQGPSCQGLEREWDIEGKRIAITGQPQGPWW